MKKSISLLLFACITFASLAQQQPQQQVARRNAPQVIYSQPSSVCYSQPQQPVVINGNSKNENHVIGIIRFLVVLAFVGLIAYFIFGGSPDVLVSYVNSGVGKISEVLSNVHF